jgi:hypothetical protein
MIYSSLEPPRRGDSNGSKFIPIQSLDAEIINETACGAVSVNAKSLMFRQFASHPMMVKG